MTQEQCPTHHTDIEYRAFQMEASSGALQGGIEHFCPTCEVEDQERLVALRKEAVQKLNTFSGQEVAVVFRTRGFSVLCQDSKGIDFEEPSVGIMTTFDEELNVHFINGQRISLFRYSKLEGTGQSLETKFDRIVCGDQIICTAQQVGL